MCSSRGCGPPGSLLFGFRGLASHALLGLLPLTLPALVVFAWCESHIEPHLVAGKGIKVGDRIQVGDLIGDVVEIGIIRTRLLEAGRAELASQANMEIEKIKQAGTMSPEGRKRLKYGTRAMFNQTINLDEE